jgi:Protein of unknown function (DUF3309)
MKGLLNTRGAGLQARACASLRSAVDKNAFFTRDRSGATSPHEGERMLLILIILLLVFGFGGFRLGPGLGYYGGGGISLIILIVIILLLLKVI